MKKQTQNVSYDDLINRVADYCDSQEGWELNDEWDGGKPILITHPNGYMDFTLDELIDFARHIGLLQEFEEVEQ